MGLGVECNEWFDCEELEEAASEERGSWEKEVMLEEPVALTGSARSVFRCSGGGEREAYMDWNCC